MKLEKEYLAICNPPPNADKTWFINRGFTFERILNKLLLNDKLEPRSGFKPDGEQIDGSFFLDGSVLLLEAKWHKSSLPASSIYQFKGKVDGKLQGTLGVFISMSGYSTDAVDALTLGKSLNIILFGREDIEAAILRKLSFRNILKNKLRKAAEEGVVYYPTEIEEVTRERSQSTEIENFSFDPVSQTIVERRNTSDLYADLVIICEGDSDRRILSLLCSKILNNEKSGKKIKIVVAMGKHVIPKVANALNNVAGNNVPILIVADSDGDRDKTFSMFNSGISFDNWRASIPDPEIEAWLGLSRVEFQKLRRKKNKIAESIDSLASKIDIDNLKDTDSSFKDFYEAIVSA